MQQTCGLGRRARYGDEPTYADVCWRMLTYADVCNRPVDWDDALAMGTSLIVLRPDAVLFDFFLRESSTSESFDGSDRGLLHALYEGTQFTCFTGLN